MMLTALSHMYDTLTAVVYTQRNGGTCARFLTKHQVTQPHLPLGNGTWARLDDDVLLFISLKAGNEKRPK